MPQFDLLKPCLRREYNLSSAFILSSVIAILIAGTSALGLISGRSIYPTDELINSFLPNDIVNLFLGLPLLVVSMHLAKRGKLTGLLLWPGALFFQLYTNSVYVQAIPQNVSHVLHLTLVVCSAYTLIDLIAGIDRKQIQHILIETIPERISGGILTGLGILFLLRCLIIFGSHIINQAELSQTERALNTVDFIFAPAWIIGGILLWQRKALGYVAGLGLLFQGSMLFIGLIVSLLLQPFLLNTTLAISDVITIFVLGLICYIPFAQFLHSVAKQGMKYRSS